MKGDCEMILELKQLIPSLEMLQRRVAEQHVQKKPSKEELSQMAGSLKQYGYERLNPSVFDAVCEYGAMFGSGIARKGMFLKGGVGIGKTFGVEILAAIYGWPVFTPMLLASAYKECSGNLVDLEKIVLTGNDFWEKPHTIVIDDLGTQDSSRCYGQIADLMCDVLDMRYRAMLRYGVKTVVTTNLDDTELVRRYGIRTNDRLNEMFYFYSVKGSTLR